MSAPAMAGAGMGASLLAGFVHAAGDLFKGAAEGKFYEFQAGIAKQQAQVAQQNANWSIQAGEQNALVSGYRTRAALGHIAAGQGSSNISLSSPSSTAVRAGQTEIGQVDQSIIRTDAARRAFGYEVEGATKTAEAGALSTASATSRTASYYSAASSILGGAGQVSEKWVQASQAGINPFGGGAGTPNPTASDPNFYNA